jgi:hypothetical protein
MEANAGVEASAEAEPEVETNAETNAEVEAGTAAEPTSAETPEWLPALVLSGAAAGKPEPDATSWQDDETEMVPAALTSETLSGADEQSTPAPGDDSDEEPSVALADLAEGEAPGHQVTVSWRGEEYMKFLELDTPPEDDTHDLIIVEPPTQLFAPTRRRRAERSIEVEPVSADSTPAPQRPARPGAPEADATVAPEPAAPAPAPAPAPPSSTGMRVLLVILLLVGIAALVWYFLFRDTDTPSVVESAALSQSVVVTAAAHPTTGHDDLSR